ncbi:hypothetical protein [Candidatus Pelagibacter communis]|uniref:hypothetical protein n=1 Tax=Pelagibacter ubique TaxID=198252 RepID=UPI00094CDA0E|nr:hypothetical protein [Candidatus Pelagibacter ubique]
MLILKDKSKLVLFLSGVLIFLIHQIIFLSYLDFEKHHFDFQSALSRLIFGKIWFLKNGLDVPWFAPHVCCGLPLYSNPESEFYSPIQFLFLFLNPLTTFKVIFFLYSLIGFCGFFLVLRNIFKLSNNASLIGSTIFLFNHCFAFHYLSGHIAWGLYYVVPFFFYVCAISLNNLKKISSLFLISCAGLIFAIIMHSGGTRIVIEILIFVFFLTVLHLINFKNFKIILHVSVAVLIGLMISSSKIYAGWSFVGELERDVSVLYFKSIRHFISVFFDFFFLSPREVLGNDVAKFDVLLSIEELSFNLSIVPLIILVIYLRNVPEITKDRFKLLISLVLIIAVFVLILLNFSNTFLGSLAGKIPFMTTDWLSLRKLTPFVLLFSILTAMMFDKISFKKYNLITLLFISIIIIQNISFDRNKLNKVFRYSELDILLNYNVTKNNVDDFRIEKVLSIVNDETSYSRPYEHHYFLKNLSIQYCYFPILGYDLKLLKPIVSKIKFNEYKIYDGSDENNSTTLNSEKKLKLRFYQGDPFLTINNEDLNFINPSCYLNPEGNNCEKNFFFKIDQKEELVKFLNYKPFKFKHLKLQIFFNYLSIFTLILIFTLFFLCTIYRIKKNPSNKH